MPTWQLSTLPARPHHCRATPTDALPCLRTPDGVDDQHAVGPADRRADLPNQFVDHGLPLPGLLANELLHGLPILLVKIGDGFDVLAFDVGDQTGDVFGGVLPLGIMFQAGRERFDELVEPLEHALQRLGFYLCFRHQFFVTHRKSSFHDLLLSV